MKSGVPIVILHVEMDGRIYGGHQYTSGRLVVVRSRIHERGFAIVILGIGIGFGIEQQSSIDILIAIVHNKDMQWSLPQVIFAGAVRRRANCR